MRATSSLLLALATIVLSFSLHQGVNGESVCKLVLSQNNQSLVIRIGSRGELKCQISPECNLTRKRVMGPFWRRSDGKWFVPNTRMYNTRINSTTIALRYTLINHEDLGIYICVARIGRKRLRAAANITERLANPVDVDITPGPERPTEGPRKKRSAAESLKSFVGVGLVRAAPLPRIHRRQVVRRSLQGPTRNFHVGNPPLSDDHSAVSNNGFQPLKTPCDGEEKLFSKTGIIIVAALVCSTFLLLYMVVLLMAVPRICFPYYPKKNNTGKDEKNTNPSKDKESSTKVDIPLSHKVRPNGRSDSGIESVDGLEERGSQIGADRLEEFYRRTTNQEAESDEDMLSGLKRYNIEKNIPRRGRSESVPVTPYRYQSSIYVKV